VFALRHLRLSTLSHGRPASRVSASERAKVTKVATPKPGISLLYFGRCGLEGAFGLGNLLGCAGPEEFEIIIGDSSLI